VTGERSLIVSADDFGLTPGICAGVLRAHVEGVVTSTSVLALGPAFEAWAPRLRDSGLDAGAHLAVVGIDPPLLSASEIPTLVDRRGRFPTSWHSFLRRAATGRIDLDDLRREFRAQFDAITSAGIRVTHVDCHQNLQLWPLVGRATFEVARRADVHAVRLVESRRWSPRALGVRALAPSFVRRAAAAGFVHPGAGEPGTGRGDLHPSRRSGRPWSKRVRLGVPMAGRARRPLRPGDSGSDRTDGVPPGVLRGPRRLTGGWRGVEGGAHTGRHQLRRTGEQP
jgi:predicted glycoside hydrolase/deacetylase ChbG (UPF0249 family)